MQLVNTIDIPLAHRLSIRQKAQSLADAFTRKFSRIWDRLRVVLPETRAPVSHTARVPIGIGLPGYFGGAYDRLIASTPMVSCVECLGADPFPQAPASSRGTVASQDAGPASGPGGEEDISLAVLSADWVIPARMM